MIWGVEGVRFQGGSGARALWGLIWGHLIGAVEGSRQARSRAMCGAGELSHLRHCRRTVSLVPRSRSCLCPFARGDAPSTGSSRVPLVPIASHSVPASVRTCGRRFELGHRRQSSEKGEFYHRVIHLTPAWGKIWQQLIFKRPFAGILGGWLIFCIEILVAWCVLN